MSRRNWVRFFAALLLYIPLYFTQVAIDCRKTYEDLQTRLLLMPGHAAGSLVLGGFRGLAADLLWLNMEEYWHTGQHHKVLPLLESISWLQPTYVTVWAVGGWHMAYNIFATLNDVFDEAWKTVRQKEYDGLPPAEKAALKPIVDAVEKAQGMDLVFSEEGVRPAVERGVLEDMAAEMKPGQDGGRRAEFPSQTRSQGPTPKGIPVFISDSSAAPGVPPRGQGPGSPRARRSVPGAPAVHGALRPAAGGFPRRPCPSSA